MLLYQCQKCLKCNVTKHVITIPKQCSICGSKKLKKLLYGAEVP